MGTLAAVTAALVVTATMGVVVAAAAMVGLAVATATMWW